MARFQNLERMHPLRQLLRIDHVDMKRVSLGRLVFNPNPLEHPIPLTFKHARLGSQIALTFAAASAQAAGLVGLTDDNRLLTFNSATTSVASSATITGTAAGARILSIDFRNPDSQIYGLGSLGTVYKLNASTGAAMSFASGVVPVLDGRAGYEIDFNPSNNNLRIIGNNDTPNSNRALTMGTGVTAIQTGLTRSGGPVDVVGAAYNQNFGGSPTATLNLYYIDAESDVLHLNNNAFRGGVLSKVGDLTLGGKAFAVDNATGLDIAASGEAFMSWDQNLYSIELASGALSSPGRIGDGGRSNAIGLTAVGPILEPETYALMLAGFGMLSFMVKRRKLV